MKKIALVFFVLLFAGAFELVSAQDKSLKPDSFNKIIKAAAQAKERWVMHPVAVSLLYIDFHSASEAVIEHQEKISLQSTPEKFTDATVIIERSGFLDDSVSGDRYLLVLIKQQNGEWLIKSVEYSWRCWKGRGSDEYSKNPCF